MSADQITEGRDVPHLNQIQCMMLPRVLTPLMSADQITESRDVPHTHIRLPRVVMFLKYSVCLMSADQITEGRDVPYT